MYSGSICPLHFSIMFLTLTMWSLVPLPSLVKHSISSYLFFGIRIKTALHQTFGHSSLFQMSVHKSKVYVHPLPKSLPKFSWYVIRSRWLSIFLSVRVSNTSERSGGGYLRFCQGNMYVDNFVLHIILCCIPSTLFFSLNSSVSVNVLPFLSLVTSVLGIHLLVTSFTVWYHSLLWIVPELLYLFTLFLFNGWQLAKMKKSIPDMSLPWNL